MALGRQIRGVLGPQDVANYVNYLSDNQSLFRLISHSFDIKEDSYIGVSNEDLRDLADREVENGDPEMAQQLRRVLLVGEGRSCFISTSPDGQMFINHVIMFTRRRDGRYDLITAKGTQKKQLDMQKVVAAGAGSLALGVVGGTAARALGYAINPALGVGATIFFLCAGGSTYTACQDLNEPMENVVNGFLLESLRRKGLIRITDQGLFMALE